MRSFATDDHTRTFCIYDGLSPGAIRRAAGLSDLPVNRISEVSVLEPYFYVEAEAEKAAGNGGRQTKSRWRIQTSHQTEARFDTRDRGS
ncbi:MAG: DUF4242 domain-containing protein [Acidimicrobiia bacterium]|nr:DUF4242 domain-containing protein [Acidimicrobiia bacterium]